MSLYYADEYLTCPYDKAHVILKSRLAKHLTVCTRRYDKELVRCPFNAIHLHSPEEAKRHAEVCPDRGVLDRFVYQAEDSSRQLAQAEPDFNPTSSECWDDVVVTGSVIEAVKKTAQEREVYIPLIGASKAEKKAYRNAERRRFKEVGNNN